MVQKSVKILMTPYHNVSSSLTSQLLEGQLCLLLFHGLTNHEVFWTSREVAGSILKSHDSPFGVVCLTITTTSKPEDAERRNMCGKEEIYSNQRKIKHPK